MTNKQWALVGLVSVVLFVALALFGGGYRAMGTLLAPAGLWFAFRREPEQREVRPGIRVLGWVFIAAAVLALSASVFIIVAHR